MCLLWDFTEKQEKKILKKRIETLESFLTEPICDMIKNSEKLKAIISIRNKIEVDFSSARKLCEEYELYLKAYEAFKNGEKLYTEYKGE